MNRLRLVALMATLSVGVASAGDLRSISRAIGTQPKYEAQPQYCLLVFGADMKSRIWVVQDGTSLYVDRNGNGVLTDAGEKVSGAGEANAHLQFAAGAIEADGLKHTALRITRGPTSKAYVADAKQFARLTEQWPTPWSWTVGVEAQQADSGSGKLPKSVRYIANGDGLGLLVFGARPETAPVIHFNGPWTLGLQDWKQQLVVGKGKETMLQIGVGSQGIGPGTFSFVLYPGLIPNDKYPVAEIAFPSASGLLPEQRFVLKQRC